MPAIPIETFLTELRAVYRGRDAGASTVRQIEQVMRELGVPRRRGREADRT